MIEGNNLVPFVVHAMVNTNNAQLYWFTECLETYQKTDGEITDLPLFCDFAVSVRGFERNLIILKNAFINEVQKDAERAIDIINSLAQEAQGNILFAITYPISQKKDIDDVLAGKQKYTEIVNQIFFEQLVRARKLVEEVNKLAERNEKKVPANS